MGLETATYINGLVVTNPLGTPDTVAEGDDHLRLIKSTLKNTFPNITGAVTLTDAQINALGTSKANLLLNPNHTVAQRGTSIAAVADGAYTLDQWKYNKVGAMVHTVSQDASGPSFASAGVQVPFSLLVDCTTVDTSIAATDLATITNIMEGDVFNTIAQKAFTLVFWVHSNKTGTYCVAFRNSGQDRSYIAEYTISATSTWEKKTITVTASPTGGTWNFTTGVGLSVSFVLTAGSNFHTTANAWQTGNFLSTVNQVNACDSATNDFRIALVSINVGSIEVATENRHPELELILCERYLWRGLPATRLDWFIGSTSQKGPLVKLSTTMRATPTLSLDTTGATFTNCTGITLENATTSGFHITPTAPVASSSQLITFAAANFFQASAEL